MGGLKERASHIAAGAECRMDSGLVSVLLRVRFTDHWERPWLWPSVSSDERGGGCSKKNERLPLQSRVASGKSWVGMSRCLVAAGGTRRQRQNLGIPRWEELGAKWVAFQGLSPCPPPIEPYSLGSQPLCSSAPCQPPSSIPMTLGVCAMGWGSR